MGNASTKAVDFGKWRKNPRFAIDGVLAKTSKKQRNTPIGFVQA